MMMMLMMWFEYILKTWDNILLQISFPELYLAVLGVGWLVGFMARKRFRLFYAKSILYK